MRGKKINYLWPGSFTLTSQSLAFEQTIDLIFSWGWLLVVILMLWIIWKVYLYIKAIDYTSSIQWTVLQITLPEEAVQTPMAMENIFAVLDGIHKSPDLIERYFEGYVEAWYSCELQCSQDQVRYIMVVPTAHKTFFEGVIYGQYPQAEINEVEDYTQMYNYRDIDRTFDLYGTEIILTEDDIYPIKTFQEYEDTFSDDDKFIDPHQALVEAYSNVKQNDQIWLQILVRPISAIDTKAWTKKGEQVIDKLAGKTVSGQRGVISKIIELASQVLTDFIKVGVEGPLEAKNASSNSLQLPPLVSTGDKAKAEGILRKISKGGYRVRIRGLYLAPIGQLTKPNISRVIGGFKQFNSFHLNGFKPDPATRTNAPNYFMKQTRRYRRKRNVFLAYQWRDMGRYEAGFMLSDEELATLYHFPTKFVRAPAVQRAKAGVGSAPDNLPYSEK